MDITILETADEVARSLARRIADAVTQRPTLVLGLPTGRTPVDAYAELCRLHAAGEADFSRVSTFNLDEFVTSDGSNVGAFRQFMERHLFSGLNLDPGNIHFLNGAAADLDAECRRYDAAIDEAGGIDLQILGIGANGHIGFNEPAGELVGPTHRVTLLVRTRRDNAELFGGDPSRVPREALTMGVGSILRAGAIVLVATGEQKADCIERLVNGPVTRRLPASLLKLHRHVELLLDRAAASRIRRT